LLKGFGPDNYRDVLASVAFQCVLIQRSQSNRDRNEIPKCESRRDDGIEMKSPAAEGGLP